MPARTVYLGNRQAVEARNIEDDDGKIVSQERRSLPGKHCTTANIPDGMPLVEALTNITHPSGVWGHHSDADAPAWVASDWPALAAALAEHWGCELRQPEPETEVNDAN